MSIALELLQKENFMIGIPSREREFLIKERRGIWKHIDPEVKDLSVHLSILEKEYASYRNVKYSGNIILNQYNNIAEKRQKLLSLALLNKVEYLFIIDDDVSFYYRDENLSSKYTSKHEVFVKKDHFNRLLYECISLCSEKFPIVGLPLKQGSFGLKYMFSKNIPIIRFVCYHVPTLKKEIIRFDTLFKKYGAIFMSDRYAQLALIDKGYRTLSNCRYCVGDQGTNYKGGCSITRNSENQSLSAEALMLEFPNLVSLKWKEDGLWGVRRKDCKINWKKFLSEKELKYLPKEEGLKLFGIEYLNYINILESKDYD